MKTTLKLGPFEVIIDGTCSAACPFIVPKGEEFEEAVAELPAVFTVIGHNVNAETYRENPAVFEKKDCYDEVMATAHIFAAAPDLLEALQELADLSSLELPRLRNAALIKAHAAIAKATQA